MTEIHAHSKEGREMMIYRPKTLYRHFMRLVAVPGFFIFDMFRLSGVVESSSVMTKVSRPITNAPPIHGEAASVRNSRRRSLSK